MGTFGLLLDNDTRPDDSNTSAAIITNTSHDMSSQKISSLQIPIDIGLDRFRKLF